MSEELRTDGFKPEGWCPGVRGVSTYAVAQQQPLRQLLFCTLPAPSRFYRKPIQALTAAAKREG